MIENSKLFSTAAKNCLEFSHCSNKLAQKLVTLLAEKHLKIACAESCTGGLVAGAITEIAGASRVLELSVITYCDQAKNKLLGVDWETLATYTAVSKETALAMVKGVCGLADAEVGISVTGLAGPQGGTLTKPVGLVYIGLAYQEEVQAHAYHFFGDRAQIRRQAVLQALQLAIQKLQ